jgi:perosamine synthetase
MISRLKSDIRLFDLFRLLVPKSDAVTKFEERFAQLAGQQYAIAFPYGRTAQIAILRAMALDQSGRTEIICPSYTCVVVPHAIVKAGLIPVFVDCGESSYQMDWDLMAQATNDKTGAVIVTSLFGQPMDRNALDRYRATFPQVKIIQDCAHSFMATDCRGDVVNKSGDAAFFGMNISKLLTSIFGGMATTDDPVLADRIRAVRDAMLRKPSITKSVQRWLYTAAVYVAFIPFVYGVVNRLERMGCLNRFVRYYDETKIDLPSDVFDAMTPIEAKMGLIQCERYAAHIEHRRRLARIYVDLLSTRDDFQLPQWDDGATWSHFVIKTPHASRLIDQCLANGVQLGALVDYEITDMPSYQSATYVGHHRSRAYPGNVINLPIHAGVSVEQAKKIVTLLQRML